MTIYYSGGRPTAKIRNIPDSSTFDMMVCLVDGIWRADGHPCWDDLVHRRTLDNLTLAHPFHPLTSPSTDWISGMSPLPPASQCFESTPPNSESNTTSTALFYTLIQIYATISLSSSLSSNLVADPRLVHGSIYRGHARDGPGLPVAHTPFAIAIVSPDRPHRSILNTDRPRTVGSTSQPSTCAFFGLL